ncbi:MAG TPA: ATP-binding cassette domain-containing protein, partial [Azospirillum sp.]
QLRAAAEPAEPAPAPPLTGALVFDSVTYRHRADGAPALDRVSLEIPAGRFTAVVGPSGAGKSTLADLVLGLVPPGEGRILVDGRPLDGAARRAWRRRVGYVPQDAFLFHDTIRANLLAADATDESLWAALEQVAAAGFVRRLPDGLDTVVGDRGARLSGGERQRLALARALLRRPDLLVLDESTSALDAESEARILEALERLRGQVTVVVVAHRLTTVRGADHVVVLDAGRVADHGSWEAVAERSGGLLNRLAMLH